MRPRGLFLATGLAVFVGLAIGLPTANNVVPEDAAFVTAPSSLSSPLYGTLEGYLCAVAQLCDGGVILRGT